MGDEEKLAKIFSNIDFHNLKLKGITSYPVQRTRDNRLILSFIMGFSCIFSIIKDPSEKKGGRH